MTCMRLNRMSLIVAGALGLACAPATFADITFYCVSDNDPDNAAAGERQLSATVSAAAGDHRVLFTFYNNRDGSLANPLPMSITDVYFDDGTLLGIAEIINSEGVQFSQYAKPADLPSGSLATPPFTVTAGFSADSDSPVQPNGVNPGETLGIIFDLQSEQTFDDTWNALIDGSLRIGLKVQGYEDGDSESFVNNPVPAPGAVLLGVMGFGLIGCVKRRAASSRESLRFR